MTKLVWGSPGSSIYETGVDRGVLYVKDSKGVAWNGLTRVSDSSSTGELASYFYDGINYSNISAPKEFGLSIDAYSAPIEFSPCEGVRPIALGLSLTQQPRVSFGFSYRTLIGNDLKGLDHGYKLNLVYNATATPVNREHRTLGENPEASTRSWDIRATPTIIPNAKPRAHLVIDSTKTNKATLATLESYLYGDDQKDPQLPPIDTVMSWLGEA